MGGVVYKRAETRDLELEPGVHAGAGRAVG